MKPFTICRLLPFALITFCLFLLPNRVTAQDAPPYSVSVGGGSFSPATICAGMSAHASISCSLDTGQANQEYQIGAQTWSYSASVTGYAATSTSPYGAVPSNSPAVAASGGSVSATATNSTTVGYYEITVTATDSFGVVYENGTTNYGPSGSTTLYLTVVGLGTIEYDDPDSGWIAAPSDLVAMVAGSVSVRALPIPSDASFPPGNPVWSGLASGTGSTATASFASVSLVPGDQSITATLGTGSNASSSGISATTFKLITSFVPAEAFTGESFTAVGVGERGGMNFDPAPVGTPMPNTYWVLSGVGTMLNNGASTNSSGQWFGGVTSGTANFTINIANGPSKGKSAPLGPISVYLPSGGSEINDPAFYDYHEPPDASAGCNAIITLQPNNVSFDALEFGETNVVASTATGDLSILSKTPHMSTSQTPIGEIYWNSIITNNSYGNQPGKGSNSLDDQISVDVAPSGTVPYFSGGNAVYNIPWNYEIAQLNGQYTVATQLPGSPIAQAASDTASGGASISKLSANDTTTTASPKHDFQLKLGN